MQSDVLNPNPDPNPNPNPAIDLIAGSQGEVTLVRGKLNTALEELDAAQRREPNRVII